MKNHLDFYRALDLEKFKLRELSKSFSYVLHFGVDKINTNKNETHQETKNDHHDQTNSDDQNVREHEHKNQTQHDNSNKTQLYMLDPMINDTDSYDVLINQIKGIGDQIDKLQGKITAEVDKFKGIIVEIKNFLDKETASFEEAIKRPIHHGPVQYSQALVEYSSDPDKLSFKQCFDSLGLSNKSSGIDPGNFLI